MVLDKPILSVVLPVYNGEQYLHESILSILNQTFSDFELIIVNDASQDKSEEIIHSFDDPRIKYHRNAVNLGLVATLNVGIKLCSGKYIARMDQDDVSRPNRFKKQIDFLEKNTDHIIVGSHVRIMGKNDLLYPLSDASIRVWMLVGTPFAHPAVMMRADVIKKNNLFYTESFKHAEDYGLWVQLSQFGKMANLNEVLIDYRRHESQYSIQYKNQMYEAASKAQTLYLDSFNMKWSDDFRDQFIKANNNSIFCSSKSELVELGTVLEKTALMLEKTNLDKTELQILLKHNWKKKCIKFQEKKPLQSYQIFLKNNLSEAAGIKTHLFFIRGIFINFLCKFRV
jgi:glycosyltransferase involved in cell wall biosynthesis